MRTLLICICLCLATINTVQSQELPEIIPPSPNAASLGKYGKVPVGLFTGTPQINIPIYTLKGRNLAVPVSLNYSSNGIKVDEIASQVGLGWSLNAGGVITRVIMDDADESITQPIPNGFPEAATQEVLDYIYNATDPEDGYDTLSDIYSFNFNGYSGTFYLDENKIPILINPSPLKIEKPLSSVYAFKITTSNGVIYWFGSENSTEITMHQSVGGAGGGGNGWSLENPSSWYLSKMETPAGDQIEFSYTNFYQIYNSALSQSVTKSADGAIFPIEGQNLVISKTNTFFAQLNSISSNTGQINFLYAANATEFNKLDAIEIRNTEGSLIKKFNLDYDIVDSSLLHLKNPHITYADEYGKRLFLKSVTETGSSGTSNTPYLLSYYNPDQLPPRFSYAQDYWGHFNGVSTNKYLVSNDDYFFLSESNSFLLKSVFNLVGGDKKPNGNYGVNGMLKKITYPTGGNNELLYEPHSYFGTQFIYPPKTEGYLSIQNDADGFGSGTEIVTTEPIVFSQEKVPFYFSTASTPCWEIGWPSHHIKASVNVKIADQGSNVFNTASNDNGIYSLNQFGARIYHNGGLVVSQGSATEYYIDLEEGKRYRFSMNVPFECVGGDFNISYYDQSPDEIETNIEVGGLRLKKVITENGAGEQEIKNYHYGDLECIDCTSGITQSPIPSISYTRNHETTDFGFSGDGNLSMHVVDALTLSSTTLYNLYTKQGYHIGYTSVIEELGDDFSGGGILHKFSVSPTTGPYTLQSSFLIPGTPFDTNFGTGEELEKQVFIKTGEDYTILQKTTNTYFNNPVLNQERPFYNIRLRDVYSGILAEPTPSARIGFYNIVKYYKRSQWRYIENTITTQYDQTGQNPLETITNYYYDNPEHLQVTRTETLTNNGDMVETRIYYPDDVENTTILAGAPLTIPEYNAINSLKQVNQHRIAEPIQVETYKIDDLDNQHLVSTLRTLYKDWGAGLILPETVAASKDGEPLEDRISYQDYDDFGNPLEVSKKDGTPISYIWGYHNARPIAKLEGISYTDIDPGTILNLQLLSDNDTDALSEQSLRDAFDTLRNAHSNAVITAFTYDPLIGVSSITDPKGYTSSYFYDSFNRLESIKDEDGNVIEVFNYNYGQESAPLDPLSAGISYGTDDTDHQWFTADVSGGSQDYSYAWYEGIGDSSVDFEVNASGNSDTYQLMVNCSNTKYVKLVLTDNLTGETVETVKVSNNSCNYPPLAVSIGYGSHNDNSQNFTSSVSGGSGDYSYSWHKGVGTSSFNFEVTPISTLPNCLVIVPCTTYKWVKLVVTDNITGETAFATKKSDNSPCSGGGAQPIEPDPYDPEQ